MSKPEFRIVTAPFGPSPWTPAWGLRYLVCKLFVRHTTRRQGPAWARIEYRNGGKNVESA
jgi:hypothetical protein